MISSLGWGLQNPRMGRECYPGIAHEGLKGELGASERTNLGSADLTGSRVGREDDEGFKAR